MAEESLGGLFVEFSAKSTELVEGVNKAVESVESGCASMLSATKNLGEVVTGIFAAIGAAALYEAAEFEEASVKLMNVMDGNVAAVNEVSNAIKQMSTQLPFGATEMEKLAGQAMQLGIQKNQVVEFTRTMEEFGAVTGVAASQAADQFIKLANVTGLPKGEIDKMASSVVALGDHMGTTQGRILDFASQIAGTATQMRLTQPEIFGLSSAMASLGIEGGMAINRLLLAITEAANQGGPKLTEIAKVAGVTGDEFTKQFAQNSMGALQTFLGGLKNMNNEGRDVTQVFQTLGVGGGRMAEALLKAANSSDLVTKGINMANDAWEKNSALTDDAARHQETFASQIKITWNLLNNILITIGDALMPTLKLFNSLLQDVLKSHIDWGSWIQSFMTNLVPIIITAIGMVGDAWNGWIMIIKLIEIAVNGVGAVILDVWEKVSDKLQGMSNVAVRGLQSLLAIASTIVPALGALPPLELIKITPPEKIEAMKQEFIKSWQTAHDELDKLAKQDKFSDTLQKNYEDWLSKKSAADKEDLAAYDKEYLAEIDKIGEAIQKKIVDPMLLVRNQGETLINQLFSKEFPGEEDPSKAKSAGKTGLSALGLGSLQDSGVKQAQQIQNELKLYQSKLDQLKKYDDEELQLSQSTKDKLLALEKKYNDDLSALQMAQAQVAFQNTSKMFDSLATVAEQFGGKQGAFYQAMFAMSKAFAIADATVKIAQGIADASAMPFPANLAAMASVAAATASIVSSISAVTLNLTGKARGGMVSGGIPYLVGEAGPEIFVPSETGNIVPNDRMTNALGSSPTKVIVNNYTDSKPEVQERQMGGERVLEVMITRAKQEIAAEIRDGRGMVNRALQQSYTLQRGR